jgi:hypothetical protein
VATRFYLPSTGTPAISPAFNGTVWNGGTGNADRRTMVTARISSAMTDKSGLDTVTEAQYELVRQYLSESLAAQTISGSFKGQVRARAANIGSRAMALRLCKVSADGSTVTEQLARFTAIDAADTVPPAYGTTSTNRRLETSPLDTFAIAFSDITIAAGEHLMLEFGSLSNTISTPRPATLVFGDDSGTDLAEDESTTAANNPWVEFTDDITFQTVEAALVGRTAHRVLAIQQRYRRR